MTCRHSVSSLLTYRWMPKLTNQYKLPVYSIVSKQTSGLDLTLTCCHSSSGRKKFTTSMTISHKTTTYSPIEMFCSSLKKGLLPSLPNQVPSRAARGLKTRIGSKKSLMVPRYRSVTLFVLGDSKKSKEKLRSHSEAFHAALMSLSMLKSVT